MGGDDRLNLPAQLPFAQDAQEGKLALRRQRHFRLVEDVDGTLAGMQAVEKRIEESLTMAAPVQVADAVMLFEVAGKIEEAFGAEEKAAVDPRQPRQAQSLGQIGSASCRERVCQYV